MQKKKKDFFDYVSPYTKRYIKPFTDWCFSSKLNLAITIIAIILFIVFFDLIQQATIISLLILLGGVSKMYQRYFQAQLGIEFIMLSVVVGGYIFGPIIGAIIGFLTFGLSLYFSASYKTHSAVSFILLALIGFMSGLMKDYNITTVGITMTLFFNIIFVPIYLILFRARIYRITLFSLTHIVWNIWVFIALAPGFVNLLT